MKKYLLLCATALVLAGCGDEATTACETRMAGELKTPKEACECIEKVLGTSKVSMKEYIDFSEKMENLKGEDILKQPSAEMKKFFEIGMMIVQNCHQHLESKTEQ